MASFRAGEFGFRYFQSFLDGPCMQARAMLVGVSGMAGGMTKVTGRPLGRLGFDVEAGLLIAMSVLFTFL